MDTFTDARDPSPCESNTAKPDHALTDADRGALVEQWLPLAYDTANKHARAMGAEWEDLPRGPRKSAKPRRERFKQRPATQAPSVEDFAQEAATALMVAAREFDPAKGVPFGPWAQMCIRQHLRQWSRGEERLGFVKVPKRIQRGPNTPATFWPVAGRPVNRTGTDDDGVTVEITPSEFPNERIGRVPSAPTAEDGMIAAEAKALEARRIRVALAKMDPDLAHALRLRHHVGARDAEEPMPIREVAKRLGVSVGKAYEIVTAAEARLREILSPP